MANSCAQRLVAAAALAALSAVPAAALDGEVLIDQAKVAAGGISPADTPGFPVTINRSGKYKLTGNLNAPAGTDAFRISGDNVTLDLNGFRITGGRLGVSAGGVDGLTVMNGTIANFTSDGIRAGGFAIIQDMQVTNNGGMGTRLNNNGRVLRSTISENAGPGIFCLSRCLIAQNVITGQKAEAGINLQTNAGGHLVLGNVISNNTGFAIYAEGTTGYANNTVTGNGQFGGSSIIGAVNAVHPNYCNPACP